jgi:hypothetical protein
MQAHLEEFLAVLGVLAADAGLYCSCSGLAADFSDYGHLRIGPFGIFSTTRWADWGKLGGLRAIAVHASGFYTARPRSRLESDGLSRHSDTVQVKVARQFHRTFRRKVSG